ncbi:acetylglutamate kinase [Limnochorda pilosa]|uniref:Acetylglutamate kinase n=1 Tax=Limnochorda pilosa TaxID=1555112 RepID=A0A0K2SJ00_LIMPI|nr:acetylglutamate kinase [Limnochorda pilosa]
MSGGPLGQSELERRAGVLIEALPYIRSFAGKSFVIKYGGSAMSDPALQQAVITDLVLLKYVGLHPVVVHGGGGRLSQWMRRLGMEPRFVEGLRVTDAETMQLAQMVLVGSVNQEIVALINRMGGRAVGLSGTDGNLIVARKRQTPGKEAVDLGFVGEVEKVNAGLIHLLERDGYIPVISSIGVGLSGEPYNINADTVAGEVAAALKADKLILLTDVRGVMEDPADPGTLISTLDVEQARHLVTGHAVKEGMIPKLEACVKALEAGVPRAHIIDGRREHALLLELFTDRGIGTMVVG